jgi:hypothetical protein
MRTIRWLASGLICFSLVAAAGLARAQGVDVKPAQKAKRDRNVITADELAEHPDLGNAFDAVRMLRPTFLKPARTSARGAGVDSSVNRYGDPGRMDDASRLPTLFIDEVRQESIEMLRGIRAADIVEIRWMSGVEASSRYGLAQDAAAILVKMKKPGPE